MRVSCPLKRYLHETRIVSGRTIKDSDLKQQQQQVFEPFWKGQRGLRKNHMLVKEEAEEEMDVKRWVSALPTSAPPL